MSDQKILSQPLSEVIGDSFGRYAKYIIQDRALPDIRDGLKPVQRRILYAMYDLGLTPDKPYKKSARTVGEVIGKYHPHGDSSIYEAMVRMSQNWKNNLPLLDMHGNNGSIDGDSAAAMRYTECKLSEVSKLMLDDIKKETVEFTLNFDDTEKEPTVLPALLPNLLINGAVGIAAGYATNIPTHNSTEVFNALIHRIDNPNASLETIMKIIPGPDFPTGGIIQGVEGIKDAFLTGRGKFIISSKIDYQSLNKINQIIISEIPYETNKTNIIKQINDLVFDDKVPGILEVRDESDKTGIQIVIDVKKGLNLDLIKNFLLKNTHLQISYSTNFVSIVDRKPVLTSLQKALDYYIQHAILIIVRTAKFDLDKALKRLEIVEGLIKAVSIIDEIIREIRRSQSKEDAKTNLINKFNFTANQAEAIVSLRLYRLSQTDVLDLKQEMDELNLTISKLNELLNSQQIQKTYLKNLLRNFRQQFAKPRKSLILYEIEKIEIDEKAIIEQKEVGFSVSQDGYLKGFSEKVFEANKINEIGLKPNDFIIDFELSNNTNNLVIITKFAKTFVLSVHKIKQCKWKDVGTHLNDFITLESGDQVIYANSFASFREGSEFVVLTKLGLIKKVKLDECLNIKQQKLSNVTKLKDGDEVIEVLLHDKDDPQFITLLSSFGNAFIFSTAEIPTSSKNAAGVKAIRLKPNENLVGGTISQTRQNHLLAVANNGFKLFKMVNLPILKRASAGKLIAPTVQSRPNKFLKLLKVTKKDKINLLFNENQYDLFDLKQLDVLDLNQRIVNPLKFNLILNASKNSVFSEFIFEDLSTEEVKPYVPSSSAEINEIEQLSVFDNNEENE